MYEGPFLEIKNKYFTYYQHISDGKIEVSLRVNSEKHAEYGNSARDIEWWDTAFELLEEVRTSRYVKEHRDELERILSIEGKECEY